MARHILRLGSVILPALAIVACSKISINPSPKKHKFQTHLEECFANAMSQTKGSDDLFLLSAEKMGEIKDNYCIDSVVHSILSPNSSIIVDIVSGDYVISSIENSSIDINNLGAIVRDKVMVGMDVYQLTWNYRGQEYTSVAIASNDDGVYYDNIGYQALSFTSQPLIHSDDTWWPGDVDSSVFDPGIAGGDTVAMDSHEHASLFRQYSCVDRYGNSHGRADFSCMVFFEGETINSISSHVQIYKSEYERWVISADIDSFDGGEGYHSVLISWYYSVSEAGCQAMRSNTGFTLAPGVSGTCYSLTISRPGVYNGD